MSIRWRTVVTGALSYLPGVMPLYQKGAFRPNPAPAESSYGIWLKHLTLSRPHRAAGVPRHIVELGPGASLGAGIAALICGAQRYVALDALAFVELAQVLPVFERLVELFAKRDKPENAHGFPDFSARLDDARFPSTVLPDAHMRSMLAPERIADLRADLQRFVDSGGRESAYIHYHAPWQLSEIPFRGKFDFLFSHTVLQHVQTPADIWRSIAALLCAGGTCSHQISFDSHGTSAAWNGHWSYPEPVWRLALGRKAFLINREPLSRHAAMAAHSGLTQMECLTLRDTTGITRPSLARGWTDLSDNDLTTRGAFLIARKGTVQGINEGEEQ